MIIRYESMQPNLGTYLYVIGIYKKKKIHNAWRIFLPNTRGYYSSTIVWRVL